MTTDDSKAATPSQPPPNTIDADSPVRFPDNGPLPALFPPDQPAARESAEDEYFLFATPERSLEQIAAIQAAMPQGSFAPPPADWTHLARTQKRLVAAGKLRLLALGDSIVNDTMRSGWVALLQQAYPQCRISATVYVRGGGGCQHFRQKQRIPRWVIPRQPDCVFIGGISQRSPDDIAAVIAELRARLPQVEILLASGTFGTTDPRDEEALAAASYSGTGPYGARLHQLAADNDCAYLDMTSPWAEYIRTSGQHPHCFYRDAVHANEFGEQILGHTMMALWTGDVMPVA